MLKPVLDLKMKSHSNHKYNQPTQYAPFFTQTGQIPMYKKLMHVFRNMVPDETETLKERWNTTAQINNVELYTTPPISVADGLLPLLSEGLFIYNAQKSLKNNDCDQFFKDEWKTVCKSYKMPQKMLSLDFFCFAQNLADFVNVIEYRSVPYGALYVKN